MADSKPARYELRFQSLFKAGPGYSFPCDPQGRVDLDQLSEQARIKRSARRSHTQRRSPRGACYLAHPAC
mgnify:CR=1 FL=1|jgi:hypothetical protein